MPYLGLIAGVLSKFGKIGVIIGFIAGNVILTYVTNGNTVEIIYFKEILVASLGLLLIPKSIEIPIEDLFVKDLYLASGPTNRLNDNQDTVYRLNNVSEVIGEMSRTYKEVAATIVEDSQTETNNRNKELFIDELEKNLDNLEDNILYDDIINSESDITDDIFEYLNKNGIIERKDLLEIFEGYNNFIVGFDDNEANESVENNISEMIKAINDSYKTSKVNFVWKQKINENKKTISNQLEGVSKIVGEIAEDLIKENIDEFKELKEEIKNLARQKNINLLDINIKKEKSGRYIVDIYINACGEDEKTCPIFKMEKILSKMLGENIVIQKEKCALKLKQNICKQIYVSEDKYTLQLGIAKATKTESPVSGDTSLQVKLNDGKYLLALSDGMGSGPNARKSSTIAIKMLERLFGAGFDKDTSIELINGAITLNSEDETFATLDIAILDLYAGNIEFIKNGACPTFIKNGRTVQAIKALSLPAGILDNIDLVVYDQDIKSGDILLMCTDGILESNTEYQNKELWVEDILRQIETDNVQKIADIVLKESIDNGVGVAKDDMTVIVCKITGK